MTKLSTFMTELASRRWEWGVTDCLLTLADWIKIATGKDPARNYRGTYHTEEECTAILVEHRGVLALFSKVMWECGFKETETPRTGDVAIVRAHVMRRDRIAIRDTGGIVVGSRCAILTVDKGLVIVPVPIRRAWSIPCRW